MNPSIRVELSVVVITLAEMAARATPHVLTVPLPQGGFDLPTHDFDPVKHHKLETSLRDWMQAETGLRLGYVEQLYTFGDRPRSTFAHHRSITAYPISIGYLALAPMVAMTQEALQWRPVPHFFPWEDHRAGCPAVLSQHLEPRLAEWAGRDRDKQDRMRLSFGLTPEVWRDDLALERYELLYEAQLLPEFFADRGQTLPPSLPEFGQALPLDHRRILATALGRLRAKLKYRPVLFELMPDVFTLADLQDAAEAVSGQVLHKQNFRRMVLQSGFVEATGSQTTRRGGRPASEYRFTANPLWERRVSRVRFGGARRGPT